MKKRLERLCRSEKIPEGSVVSLFSKRFDAKGNEKEVGMIFGMEDSEGRETNKNI